MSTCPITGTEIDLATAKAQVRKAYQAARKQCPAPTTMLDKWFATRSSPAKARPNTCRSPCCGGPRRCSCCWSIATDGSIAMRRRRMRPVAPVRRRHDDLPMCRRVNPTPVRMAAAREHKNVLALFVDDSQFKVLVKRRGFDLLPHDGKAATR